MNFYIINSITADKTSLDLLKKSAQERNINTIVIDVENFDFTRPVELTKNDLIYRIASGNKACMIQKYLMNEKCISFYSDYRNCFKKADDIIIHQKNNLPIMKTIYDLPNNRELLSNYVKYLDGFPIIIKVLGKSKGQGVIKIDSFDSLLSISSFLSKKEDNIILRKYIKHERQGRLIVLGDKVIASHENIASVDFRTNVGKNEERKRRVVNYSDEINQIAVDAVRTLGIEFGGVDIIFDENNIPYICEVNFPCFFPRTQQLTGIDISGQMIEYLIQKSRS